MKIERTIYLQPKEFQTVVSAAGLIEDLINEMNDDETIGNDITKEDLEIMLNIFDNIRDECKIDEDTETALHIAQVDRDK